MKNQISVFVDGSEYLCTQFFDCDLGEGIEVKDENGNYIDCMWGIEIPDIDDIEETEKFNDNVETWLKCSAY
jgi:hypothetical protein